LRTLQD
jgi:hypothetical protein